VGQKVINTQNTEDMSDKMSADMPDSVSEGMSCRKNVRQNVKKNVRRDARKNVRCALEEVLWIWDDNDYARFQRRFQGRRTRKGKGKVEKEKEKEDQDEDFSDQETKEQEKEREKEKVILLKMKVIGIKMNGKDMRMRIGMKAIGPMKVKLHGNPQAGMNGKEMTMMSMDTSKEKERKERKEKQKERKVMDLKIKEKDKVMGTVKQLCEPSHPSQPSSQQEALPSSSNASGFFVTHSPVYLTSVKKTESGEQKMGPDFSGCALRGQEPRR